ncbi:MAG: squalene/phytoene synthase family protein, partial [Pseudomonadota bacterium]|nr:squalene/phytoene synthase family protein [Pseudomonadota bacterium]
MNETVDNELETPTGKGTADENFPVGSFLLSPYRRRHVALFYSLARAMDDISDNGDLLPEDKLARLDRFEKALTGKVLGDPALTKAYEVARSSTQTGVTLRHSVDLIKAFKQDAVKRRYVDWGDLMGYCNLSASPVGRVI